MDVGMSANGVQKISTLHTIMITFGYKCTTTVKIKTCILYAIRTYNAAQTTSKTTA